MLGSFKARTLNGEGFKYIYCTNWEALDLEYLDFIQMEVRNKDKNVSNFQDFFGILAQHSICRVNNPDGLF